MEFVQVNLTTPYLFFIVPSMRVSPKPEKPIITQRVESVIPNLPKFFNLPKLPSLFDSLFPTSPYLP